MSVRPPRSSAADQPRSPRGWTRGRWRSPVSPTNWPMDAWSCAIIWVISERTLDLLRIARSPAHPPSGSLPGPLPEARTQQAAIHLQKVTKSTKSRPFIGAIAFKAVGPDRAKPLPNPPQGEPDDQVRVDFTEGDKDQKDLLGGLALLVRDPMCSNGFPPKR